jgi:hypothetical protein
MGSGDIAPPQAFLTCAVDGSELSALRLSRFIPGKKVSDSRWIENWYWNCLHDTPGFASNFQGLRKYIFCIMKLVYIVLTVFQCSVYFPPSVLRNRRWVYFHCSSFIHSVICLTTGPTPLPKRFLHIVRSRASSFKWEYPVLSFIRNKILFFINASII